MDEKLLQTALDPGYVADLPALPIEELRSRRTHCQSLESTISFRRRMAQGRLDIIGAERRRRELGEESLDRAASIAQLPEVLSEGFVQRSGIRAAVVLDPEAGDIDTNDLDAIIGPKALASLSEISDEALDEHIANLSDYEVQQSEIRRVLHQRLDAIQAEITRRYRTGEASVDSLLS